MRGEWGRSPFFIDFWKPAQTLEKWEKLPKKRLLEQQLILEFSGAIAFYRSIEPIRPLWTDSPRQTSENNVQEITMSSVASSQSFASHSATPNYGSLSAIAGRLLLPLIKILHLFKPIN
jgi:hypothetical protein